MSNYTCPLCKKEVPRDLILFLDHTDQHILDKIREKHPEWSAEDGTCGKCLEYYQKMKGTNRV